MATLNDYELGYFILNKLNMLENSSLEKIIFWGYFTKRLVFGFDFVDDKIDKKKFIFNKNFLNERQ